MARRKTVNQEDSQDDVPKFQEEVVEEKVVEEPKYILKKDVTKQFKKGMEMSKEKVQQLIETGTNIDGWFK